MVQITIPYAYSRTTCVYMYGMKYMRMVHNNVYVPDFQIVILSQPLPLNGATVA